MPEAAVALATFNGAWAAAYREGTADGRENIVVKVGTASFRVGLASGGPLDDRPALVGLDATHWLVAFSEGTDPAAAGVHNVPRLRYAVIDTQSDAAPVSQALEPLDDVFRNSNQIAQLSPTLETAAEGAYIAWRSEARPGDAAGDQIWLKLLRWLPDETSQRIRGAEAELLIPRTCDGSIGDQRRPALARVGLPPSGALAIAWDDYSHSQGVSAGDPDVVVHYTPLHERLPEDGSVFAERFTGSNGAEWSSHWSRETYGSGTLLHSIQGSEGKVYSSAGAGGVLMRVNDHNALNVLMDVDVRFDLNASRSDLVARRDDADPDTYLAVRFGDYLTGKWEIYALIDGVKTVIVDRAMPYAFATLGQDIDYHMQGRIETLPNGSLALSAKFWEVDLGETQAWTMASTLSAANAGALGQVYSRFVNRSGRFGLLATLDSVNRTVTFDDFKAVFYEGSLVENLDAVTDEPAPLLRRPAAYRLHARSAVCRGAGVLRGRRRMRSWSRLYVCSGERRWFGLALQYLCRGALQQPAQRCG